MSEAEDLKYMTYCGLYCGLCSTRSRIPQQSRTLRTSMVKEGYDQWGEQYRANFKEFWNFLNDLCDPDKSCPGCRQGGGNPQCEIRKCAQKKNIDICVNCDEYPCSLINRLSKMYPILIGDGKRLKEIGLERWLQEQKKRAESGFVYSDIRNSK